MSIITIKNEKITVDISTTAAEMQSIKANGKEYLWNGDPKFWGRRAPALFPICGSLKDDKYMYDGKFYSLNQHGFAKFSEFAVVSATDSCAEFSLCANEETLKNYPFNFDLRIKYTLNEQSIEIEYKVINNDNKDMYFSIGSHEAYSCPEGIEEYEIEFDEAQTLDSLTLVGNLIGSDTVRVAENAKTLPLKYEYFETDALVFKNVKFNKAALTHKKSGKKVTVSFPGFENFLLWTIPGAKYICLEPWCGFPDIIGASENIIEKDSSIANLVKCSIHLLMKILSIQSRIMTIQIIKAIKRSCC